MTQDLFAYGVGAACLVALAGWLNLYAGFAAAWAAAWFLWRRAERGMAGLKREMDRSAEGLREALEKGRLDRLQLERALEGIQDGVLLLDAGGRLLFCNPSLERQLDASLRGKPSFYWELLREPELLQALKGVLDGGGSASREFSPARSPERHLFVSAAALPGPEGGALALFYDRTEQRKLERMRSEFAANVSHELKTPLTAIKAALETLKEGALDDAKVNRDFVDKALQHSQRLHELINDLLALAGIEEDKRLGRLDRQAQASLADALPEGAFTPDIPEGLPALQIPLGHLRQILSNLTENAQKYAGPGTVISAKLLGREIEVSVSDRGPGIPPEDLPRVFERFYRVDKARVRSSQASGSGLGLAIVKHLVENYGGQVGVENRPEGGCRFWFRLEKAPPA